LEAPGELAAGPEQAFGLPLPRSFTVKRFEDVVVARGQAAVEPVLTFVRRRASDPTVQRIGTRWVFPQTKVTGAFQPRTVRVEISQPAAQGVVEILVRDVTPAPPADDAEFLRRVHLDLAGRIPTPAEVHAFLADRDPNKRSKYIDELLRSPRFALHFANVWRAELIPEVAANGDARFFQPGFEEWLRLRFRANAPYDAMVRELIAAPIAVDGETPRSVYRDPNTPNPLAFYAVKDAKPENLASAATRTFLGIRIECAQCHNHPFASWTREQFWSQAAFFAGIERQGDGVFVPLTEKPNRRELVPTEGKKPVAAAFLDDATPAWKDGTSSRVALAEWVTSPTNPFFARASVNRVWGQLMGVGVVDPVDDFHDDNPPSHPELLDDLAKAFVDAKFDTRFVIAAVCRSKAYQRTTARTHPSQADPRRYAGRAAKGLTAEQFYDSLILATGYRDGDGPQSPRRAFLTRFAPQGKPTEPETSIPQALSLMNGRFTATATDIERSPTLLAVAGTPGWTSAERIEALYLVTLSRKPTAEESQRAADYLAKGGDGRLADVFWVLLNGAEFRLNH